MTGSFVLINKTGRRGGGGGGIGSDDVKVYFEKGVYFEGSLESQLIICQASVKSFSWVTDF